MEKNQRIEDLTAFYIMNRYGQSLESALLEKKFKISRLSVLHFAC